MFKASIRKPTTEELHLATLVAGHMPPSWLLHAARVAIGVTNHCLRSEAVRLRRSELRERLKELLAAVKTVVADLDDWDIRAAINAAAQEDEAGVPHDDQEQLAYHAVRWIERCANKSLSNLKIGKGRYNNRVIPGAFNSREVAAVFVVGLWREVHGAFPPKTARPVLDACQYAFDAANDRAGTVRSGDRRSWAVHIGKAVMYLGSRGPDDRNSWGRILDMAIQEGAREAD